MLKHVDRMGYQDHDCFRADLVKLADDARDRARVGPTRQPGKEQISSPVPQMPMLMPTSAPDDYHGGHHFDGRLQA